MSDKYQALSIPPQANERGGTEILRCAVIDSEFHLTLRPIFSEAEGWGILFAEVARHVASVYAQERRFTEEQTLTRISAAFEHFLRVPPDVVAKIGPLGS
jgi:hypothetical protein